MPGRLPMTPSPTRVDRLARQGFEGGVRGTSALPRPIPGPTRSQLNRPRTHDGLALLGYSEIIGPSISASSGTTFPWEDAHGTTNVFDEGDISTTLDSLGFLMVDTPGTYALLVEFTFSSFSGNFVNADVFAVSDLAAYEIPQLGRFLPPDDGVGNRQSIRTLYHPPIPLTTPDNGFVPEMFLSSGGSCTFQARGTLMRFG